MAAETCSVPVAAVCSGPLPGSLFCTTWLPVAGGLWRVRQEGQEAGLGGLEAWLVTPPWTSVLRSSEAVGEKPRCVRRLCDLGFELGGSGVQGDGEPLEAWSDKPAAGET